MLSRFGRLAKALVSVEFQRDLDQQNYNSPLGTATTAAFQPDRCHLARKGSKVEAVRSGSTQVGVRSAPTRLEPNLITTAQAASEG